MGIFINLQWVIFEANNCFSINGYVVLKSVVNICFDVEIIVLHLFDYLYQA